MALVKLRHALKEPSIQLRLSQIVTILGTARILRTNNPRTYEQYSAFAHPVLGASSGWTPARLRGLRPVTALAGAWWLLRPSSRLASAAFVTSSTLFQAETVRFHRPLWSYTNHLQVLSALEALVLAGPGCEGRRPRGFWGSTPDDVLRVMELYLAWIYGQAAASKMIHGGIAWVTSASTLRASLSELGRPPCRRLIRRQWLMQMLAGGSLLAEAGVLPLVVVGGRRIRAAVGAGIAGFHGGIKATLNISFWHLWWHLTPLLAARRSRTVRALVSTAPGLLALGMMGGNLIATAKNRNFGPFCAYNMFFGTAPDEYPQLRVRILYEDGTESGILDVRGLMPFEFFRTVSMLEHAFLHEAAEPFRETCAAVILHGLNDRPWGPRDEVNGSLRAAGDPKVTGFDLLVMRTSSASEWRSQLADLDRITLAYSYSVGLGCRTRSSAGEA